MKKLLSNFLTKILTLSALLATCFYTACTTTGPKTADTFALSTKTGDEISIMNYNVENLFDNVHDENREDFAYLPASKKQTPEHKDFCAKIPQNGFRDECLNFDWSDESVQAKLKNISEVILGVDGMGPDILVLEEVENERILAQLNKDFLAKAQYQTQVLIEGFDDRGIDVAVLSRFPILGKAELHRIPYAGKTAADIKWMAKSRGVLEVTLKTPAGAPLTILGAHFPSQQNPRYWREQAVTFTKILLAEKSAKNMVLLSGDLNISAEEEKEAGFFRGAFSEVGYVSHLVGCKKCEGTHNYRQSWSFLDVMVFSKNLVENRAAAYRLEPDSIRVVGDGGLPQRFNNKNRKGTSDHFPLYARLVKNAPLPSIDLKNTAPQKAGKKED